MFHVDFCLNWKSTILHVRFLYRDNYCAFALHAEGRMFESHAAATDLIRITG